MCRVCYFELNRWSAWTSHCRYRRESHDVSK